MGKQEEDAVDSLRDITANPEDNLLSPTTKTPGSSTSIGSLQTDQHINNLPQCSSVYYTTTASFLPLLFAAWCYTSF